MKLDPRLHQNAIVYKAGEPFYNIVQLEERKGSKPEQVVENAKLQVAEVAALLGVPAERLRLQPLNYNTVLVADADSPATQVASRTATELRWYRQFLRIKGDDEGAAALTDVGDPRGDVLILPSKLLSPGFDRLVPKLA